MLGKNFYDVTGKHMHNYETTKSYFCTDKYKIWRKEAIWGLIWEKREHSRSRHVSLSGRIQAIIRERNYARIGIVYQNKLKLHFKSFSAKNLKLLYNTVLAPSKLSSTPCFYFSVTYFAKVTVERPFKYQMQIFEHKIFQGKKKHANVTF